MSMRVPQLMQHDTQEIAQPAFVADAEIDVRRLALQTLASLLLVMVAIGTVVYVFKGPMTAASRFFVEALGGAGVGVGFFAVDAFTLPLPNDAFSAFALLGGVPYWEVVAWGGSGSLLGGLTAWAIGRGLGKTAPFRTLMERRGAEVTHLMGRYGALTLAIAAMTPIPYSVAAYACGAGGMSIRLFLWISLLRPVRVALYAAMIVLGLLPSGI